MAVGTATAAWLFSSNVLKSISKQSSGGGQKPARKFETPIDTILGQSRLVLRVSKDLVGLITGEQSALPTAVEGVRQRTLQILVSLSRRYFFETTQPC